jgi:hypothetical protein
VFAGPVITTRATSRRSGSCRKKIELPSSSGSAPEAIAEASFANFLAFAFWPLDAFSLASAANGGKKSQGDPSPATASNPKPSSVSPKVRNPSEKAALYASASRDSSPANKSGPSAASSASGSKASSSRIESIFPPTCALSSVFIAFFSVSARSISSRRSGGTIAAAEGFLNQQTARAFHRRRVVIRLVRERAREYFFRVVVIRTFSRCGVDSHGELAYREHQRVAVETVLLLGVFFAERRTDSLALFVQERLQETHDRVRGFADDALIKKRGRYRLRPREEVKQKKRLRGVF